jgi:serine protease Do
MNRWALAAGCLLVGGLIGSYFVAPVLYGQPGKQPPPPALTKELTSYRDLVKRVLPAVVSLDAKVKGQQGGEAKPAPGEAPKPGFGSGVLVDPRGVILTSFHVVEGAEAVLVTFHDGRQMTARDIRGDKKTDLAIVVLDGKGMGPLPYLALGDSEAMEIGDRVLAVGAPFGLAGSVTHGIISGKGRNGLKLNKYEDFLQTDAAINPGNSGGPLINLEGKVVGINAAIKSKSGGFQGVGLAVASNLAKTVVNALLTDGVVKRGYLGCYVRELSPEVAATLGLGKQGGVIVAEVYENTPAAKAGLKPGDIILTIAGRPVPNTKTLENIVLNLPLNQATTMTMVRDGKTLTLKVTILELPDDFGVQTGPK